MAHRDPAAARQIAALGGYAKAAKHVGDPAELTAKAKRAADQRFVDQARVIAPDDDERAVLRRAAILRREFYQRLAYLSAEARRKGKHDDAFTLESGA